MRRTTARTTSAIIAIMVVMLITAFGCKKSGEAGQKGGDELFSTPEKTFEQVKKALVNRSSDLLWDILSKNMVKIFDDGRKELLAKPLADRKVIATEGMTTVEELSHFDAKQFFAFYFNYKKHEVYRMNSAELLERKVDAVKNAKVLKVTCDPSDCAKADKAYVVYELGGEEYMLPMVKEGAAWHIDQMDEPKTIGNEQ